MANGLDIRRLGLLQALPAGIDHVFDHSADHAPNRLVNAAALLGARVIGSHLIQNFADQRNAPQILQR